MLTVGVPATAWAGRGGLLEPLPGALLPFAFCWIGHDRLIRWGDGVSCPQPQPLPSP